MAGSRVFAARSALERVEALGSGHSNSSHALQERLLPVTDESRRPSSGLNSCFDSCNELVVIGARPGGVRLRPLKESLAHAYTFAEVAADLGGLR